MASRPVRLPISRQILRQIRHGGSRSWAFPWPVSRPSRWVWLLSACVGQLGCAGESAPPSPRSPTQGESLPPSEAPVADEGEPIERWVASLGLFVSLPPSFEEQPARGGWAGFSDGVSSQLWLMHAVARRSVTLAECEREARESLRLLREGGAARELGELAAPADYVGRVWSSDPDGERTLVSAVGTGTGRCFAAVFEARGASRAARARFALDNVLSSVRLPSLDERALGRRFQP